jgi:hypothetical protein
MFIHTLSLATPRGVYVVAPSAPLGISMVA